MLGRMCIFGQDSSLKSASEMLEGLTGYQPGKDSIVPRLAELWDMNVDGTEWTFYLCQDVLFHDGTPFDAQAVVANLKRHQ